MANETMPEAVEALTHETREMHRAISSLMEELQAIDWYQIRIDVCADPALKAALSHNKNEEIEHASMLFEWVRRNSDQFNRMMRKYLFTEQPITLIEKVAGTDGSAAAVTEVAAVGGATRR